MPRQHELTIEERQRIVNLHLGKLGYKKIAKETGYDISTISSIIKKFKKHHTVQNLPKSGRPRKTSKKEDQIIKRVAIRSPTQSNKSLLGTLSSSYNINISEGTLINRLEEAAIKSYAMKKKPLISQVNQKRRLEWAKQMVSSSINFKDIVFSDVTKIKLNERDGPRRVRDNRLGRIADTSNSQESVCVWGFISYYGEGKVAIIEESINSDVYKDILEHNLLPFMRYDAIFQQDSTACHKSELIMNWMSDIGLQTIDWPAQSKDLNLIENVWNKLKLMIRDHQPQNKNELIIAIQVSFEKILNSSLIKRLYESYYKRLRSVINANGGQIDY